MQLYMIYLYKKNSSYMIKCMIIYNHKIYPLLFIKKSSLFILKTYILFKDDFLCLYLKNQFNKLIIHIDFPLNIKKK